MPSWVWTVDATATAEYNRSVDDLWAWDVWGPDYFGSGRNSEHTVTEGRWAYIGVQGDQWANVAHNSYGLLRAPWNNNPRPWLTRSNSMCGITTTGMPSCMIHFQARARARERSSLSLSLRASTLALFL